MVKDVVWPARALQTINGRSEPALPRSSELRQISYCRGRNASWVDRFHGYGRSVELRLACYGCARSRKPDRAQEDGDRRSGGQPHSRGHTVRVLERQEEFWATYVG
jgi:hypothetical protein